MEEDEFWDKFFTEYFECDVEEYLPLFDVTADVCIVTEEWWEEMEDGIYVKTLQRNTVDLTNDDEPIFP